ncbi:MAG TPA: hypothetical protein DCM67_03405 [Propionibacteriaceae bacterium]|nr:hypothetical protein [Propionibacteriaceae bacterium]
MTLSLKLGHEHAAVVEQLHVERPLPARTPLFAGEDLALLAHMSAKEATNGLAQLCGELRLGAVYCTSRAAVIAELANLHHRAGGGPALFDRDLYTGKGRLFAGTHNLDPTWVAAQRRSGLEFGLTDSAYIAADDDLGLKRTLDQAMVIPGAIAALPVASRWVSHRAGEMVTAINRAGVPVALMLEHAADPFSAGRTVKGLLEILDSADVPVLLLRSDSSAIGALAFGAAHAAIGTSSSRRHVFPLKSGHAIPGVREESAYVLSAMSYRKLSTINHAIAVSEGDDIPWICELSCCEGARLDGLATREEATRHSLVSQQDLLGTVLLDAEVAAAGWKAKCTHALSINEEMSRKIKSTWPVPAFLQAWTNAVR